MRATAFDDRLEAIAGKPAAFMRGVGRINVSPGSTIVAVGHYTPSPNGMTQILLLGHLVEELSAQVNTNGDWYYTRPVGDTNRGANGAQRWVIATVEQSPTVYVGLHTSDASRNWFGGLLTAVYNHQLTPEQARRVRRWLARRLALSLSLSG